VPLSPSALGLPPLLPYRDGLPVPAGYHVEDRSAKGLVYTGALSLAASYAAGIGIGLGYKFEGGLGWLAVPVVGAWPAIAGHKIKCSTVDVEAARQCLKQANREVTKVVLVAIDGMVQTTSLLLLFAGLASGHQELVLDSWTVQQVSATQRPEGGFDINVAGRF